MVVDVSEAVASILTLPLEGTLLALVPSLVFLVVVLICVPFLLSLSQQWCNQISFPSISVLLSQQRRAASASASEEMQTEPDGSSHWWLLQAEKRWESHGAGQILKDIRAPACREMAVICWRRESSKYDCSEVRSSGPKGQMFNSFDLTDYFICLFLC